MDLKHDVVFVQFIGESEQFDGLWDDLTEDTLKELAVLLFLFHQHNLSVDGIYYRVHVVEQAYVHFTKLFFHYCFVGLLCQSRKEAKEYLWKLFEVFYAANLNDLVEDKHC